MPSVLTDLLTEAFGEPPRKPAKASLASGIGAQAYWSFEPVQEIVVPEHEP